MTRFQHVVYILTKKLRWLYILIAIGLWVWSFWLPITAIFAACLTFAIFDLVGYEGLQDDDCTGIIATERAVMSYRVMQFLFYLSLCAILFAINYKIMLGFTIIHITGGCDILYDLIGRYPVCLPYPRTWLRWTPLGWFHKEVYNFGFITQAIVGLIGAILLNVL